jgi:hypothetical protein
MRPLLDESMTELRATHRDTLPRLMDEVRIAAA